jgi:hypothetical protein
MNLNGLFTGVGRVKDATIAVNVNADVSPPHNARWEPSDLFEELKPGFERRNNLITVNRRHACV